MARQIETVLATVMLALVMFAPRADAASSQGDFRVQLTLEADCRINPAGTGTDRLDVSCSQLAPYAILAARQAQAADRFASLLARNDTDAAGDLTVIEF